VQKLKTAEDVCWEKIQILTDALDEIITKHADSGTLKKIAREAIKQLKEDS
tara:strand:+ start:201 stop:353 length:153 start_codon:yes stop_codon:yes gene_type:complete